MTDATETEMTAPILVADNVSRRVPGSDGFLVRNISLEVYPGEHLFLTGPSGAGKTVIMRMLALLDPVDEGSVRWRGHGIVPSDVPRFRSRVVYLHQRPTLLEGTVEDNLKFPFSFECHRERTYSQETIVAWLQFVGRDESLVRRHVGRLSGGEGQLVALVRALQLEPEVVLLDEPTASTDERTTLQIERLVQHWVESGADRASVWVSHDTAQLRRMASRQMTVSKPS